MKYHALIFPKIKKDDTDLSSAAVVIGALRVNTFTASQTVPLEYYLLISSVTKQLLLICMQTDWT